MSALGTATHSHAWEWATVWIFLAPIPPIEGRLSGVEVISMYLGSWHRYNR